MKPIQTRIRYEKETDRIAYEIWSDVDKCWNLDCSFPCVQRKGAKANEDTDYVPLGLVLHIVRDCYEYNAKIHLA